MKKVYSIFLFLFISATTLAQGIAIQGIARDNTSSAITNTTLTYTFSITKNDNTILYKETQSIKTDNFGVFSHIVSTGNPVTNTFTSVDFSLENLKIKVSVNYSGNTIDVYDQPFQYVPYAKYAENGVPTGTVVAFTGTTAPRGWLLCRGQSITSITGATALRALVGNNAPNLQGTFLRGTGVSATNGRSGPELRTFQADLNKSHDHSATSNTAGNHNHTERGIVKKNGGLVEKGNWYQVANHILDETQTGVAGAHQHTITVANDGGLESRPVNYGVNYIIKL